MPADWQSVPAIRSRIRNTQDPRRGFAVPFRLQSARRGATMAAMRLAIAIYLWIRFAIGALLGLVIGVVVFPISWYRAARAVHAEGVVCRAELIADDPRARRLAGP